MDTSPPAGVGQRTLAAILFTDVVGFSTRMEENEHETLGLLRSDIEVFSRIAGEHSGVILKSTGDGVLCYFNSAVEAVACAVAFQREIAAREPVSGATTLPLEHRIGIHLGDVFVDQNDVHGDGVNVAARIQAEAEPGGICISQTVYDVVRNKLELRTTFLGERELKNLRTAIPIYSVLLGKDAASTHAKSLPKPRPQPRSTTPMMVAIGALAGALVVALIALFLITRSRTAARAETQRASLQQNAAKQVATAEGGTRPESTDLKLRQRPLQDGPAAQALPEPRTVVEGFLSDLLKSHGRTDPVVLKNAQGSLELQGWMDESGLVHLNTPRGEVVSRLEDLNARDFTYLAFAVALDHRASGKLVERRFILPLRAYARAEGIRDPRIFQLADEASVP